MRMKSDDLLRNFLSAVAMILLDWLTVLSGWWWATLLLGLIGSLVLRKSRALLLAFCSGCLGWALPLIVLATQAPLQKTADAVESVVGVSATGGIMIIVLTIFLGGLLSILGVWTGLAVQGWLPVKALVSRESVDPLHHVSASAATFPIAENAKVAEEK